MPQASVKRLIECKKDQLIDLVLDIEKYPEFVPFCLDSHVYEKNKEGSQTFIIADLTIGKGPFKDTYKSDVKFNRENSTINVTNIGGPLNHLENNWKFIFYFKVNIKRNLCTTFCFNKFPIIFQVI